VFGRDAIVGAITSFLANHDPRLLGDVRAALQREIDAAGPAALAALNERLARAGQDWVYSPPDPLARRIHHVLADTLLDRRSSFDGLEHVRAVAGQPALIFVNHLSYSDANLIEILLHRAGVDEVADRLTVMAGPKVYSSTRRRFSSLCFGTIKTPQSTALSSEDAVMNPREVARAARRAIEIAHERLALGDAVLVFVEGTRSRTSGMQPALPGVARYLDGPARFVLPVGITGTEALFPVGDESLHIVPIHARAGRPIDAAALRADARGDRRAMMDLVGRRIAELLPASYRGVYGTAA
jgi:1-acyl-sn-glycerol-3-phosphate acyltransferase